MMKRSQRRGIFIKLPFLRQIPAAMAGKNAAESEKMGCAVMHAHCHSVFLRPGNITGFRGKRISSQFLEKEPWFYGEKSWNRLFLLNRDGVALIEVRQRIETDEEFEDGETIASALEKINSPAEVGWVVEVEPSKDRFFITLYRIPKYDLASFVAAQAAREQMNIPFYFDRCELPLSC